MASATDSTQPKNDDSSSYFQKTVCLYDWWLTKADKDFEGKQLAIAGLTSRQREAVRPFVSAPIVKRYDTFSLETADGIYIILRGLINKLRCSENGFPLEVFNHFLFGFPRDWECYAVNRFTVELTTGIDSGSALTSKSSEIGPEILFTVAEKSTSLHSDSQEKTSGNNEKSIPEDSHNVSEIGQDNAASGNVSSRLSAGVQNIKICDQKKTTSGGPSKHPDKEQNPTSESLENSDREKRNSPRTPIQSRGDIDESSEETTVLSHKETNMPSKQLVGEFASSVLRPLPANTKGQNKRRTIVRRAASEKRMTSSVLAGIKRKMPCSISADIKRVMTRSISVDSKRKISQSVSADPKREMTMSVSAGFKGKMSRSVSASPKKKVTRSVSVNSKKKITKSGSSDFNHMRISLSNQFDNKNENGKTKVDDSFQLNHDANQGQNCKSVPIKHAVQRKGKKKLDLLPPGLVDEDIKTSKIKIAGGKDDSHAKTDSLSVKKINKRSRSGRLLLPPLEFWRNQIPVYDSDHKILEVREGPSVESPFRERGSQSQKKQRQ